ncbi:MAG: (Fe-S)-binding protein [Anaerolineales bacterium]|nr:(Fe-S)-binding protein [Anaerolineales bacterium]
MQNNLLNNQDRQELIVMLSTIEKLLFLLLSLTTAYFAYQTARKMIAVIGRGHGSPDWGAALKRLPKVLGRTLSLSPVWRARPLVSFFHALIAWGFIFYLLVNLGDLLEGYIAGLNFLGEGVIGDLYRLFSDLFSASVLAGMIFMLLRRFAARDQALSTREETLLHPDAVRGRQRDSLIVGAFVILHVGARLAGESFQIGLHGADRWQLFANLLSLLSAGWSENALIIGEHIGWWLALGSIMLFVPYFLYSKHVHLIFAPINFLLTPEFSSPGELEALDFEDQSIEQFGASRLEDLSFYQIMDAYACIQCNRCQEVCPAYETGKVLSPAALEINKRYFINQEINALAAGEASSQTLLEFAIPPEAVMACTACGACTNICPVGNDPMRDILDIRRSMVLMENNFPEQWQNAFRGMERTANPWGVPPSERMKWAEGFDVPTIDLNPAPDLLWWVGCAPATEANAQKTAQAFAQILKRAGVNYAVLGQQEQCTGDSARRAGNEYLFYELALGNVEMLNEVAPQRIVTTCPHCLHTLKNEYRAFGGEYEVIHHTELIDELIAAGKLKLDGGKTGPITFHDPCYLGRQNEILIAPRDILNSSGAQLVEMARHGEKSFCCGAGGAQMWKEEEHGQININRRRFQQAAETDTDTLAVACPFCMVMMQDAAKAEGRQIQVKDIAQIIVEGMEE